MSPGKWLRTSLLVLICGLFVLHSIYLPRLPLLDTLERATYDIRLRMTVPGGVDDRIIIADIDEKSLTALGHWPWDRGILARFMDTMFDHYQVKSVGYDVLFAEPDTDPGVTALRGMAEKDLRGDRQFQRIWKQLGPTLDFDQQFADSFRDRNVVLGYVFAHGQDSRLNVLPPPAAELPESFVGRLELPQPQGFSGNLEVLQSTAWGGGFFDNPTIDIDGVFRRVPLLQEFEGKLYGSLALSMVRASRNDPSIELILDTQSNYPFVDALRLGEQVIPLAPLATVLVPYRGGAYSFPYYSITDILEKKIPEEKLRGRIVLVGSSAPGLKDQRTTPLETTYPGVEVHANLIAGLLDNNIKRQPGWVIAVEFFLLLTISIVLGLINARLEPMRSLIVTMAALLAVVVGNMYAWHNNLVLPLASPVMLILFIFVFQTLWGFFVEARDKRMLAKLFGQYIPPELVEEMAESPDKISVSGESRDMTVLFSDVRGFTTISEGLDPHALTQLMNEMLTPMTHVIHHHRGTIDKYMGDAIMAFWGAPLNDDNHARHALEAGLEMVKALPQINQRFRNKGWPEINIGVGLNSGVMSVGNMGSEFRMAYTVMGDAVNLGSRLEGLTKQYGVNIIVSEFTKAKVPDYSFLELDRVRVKGKDEPVIIFEPLGATDKQPQELLDRIERFHTALLDYRQQRWDVAESAMKALAEEEPQRKIYGIYLERIEHFREDPPDIDWDGVFTHTSK
ncbi:MAG: adenylate/guanylate cyclase domain-containing protein [Alcanivoracaceae bacterium]|nr:adenylate/guanylate cyclase domain-containing protein [Alcanivoracaceae bacterium]